jgi:anti-anti-sigma factor
VTSDPTDEKAPGDGAPADIPDEIPFTASIRREGSRAIVEIGGELDLTTVEPLSDALREAVEGDVETVDLDTAGVTFIDSRALAMFLAFQLNGPKEGVKLRIVAASEAFARVASLAGLEADLLGNAGADPDPKPEPDPEPEPGTPDHS